MYLQTIVLLTVLGFVIADNCDKLGVLFYEDLGCTPISKGLECPKKFECHGLERSGKDCLFRGQKYRPGEFTDEDRTYSICRFCSCGENDNEFFCMIFDCPEWFEDAPPLPGCYRNYTVGDCCSSGDICPTIKILENGSKVESYGNIAMCDVDGKTYKEGQRFSSVNSCHDCVCTKDWKGKAEEQFCIRKACGIQLDQSEKIYKSCAPIYTKDTSIRCCPTGFYCPDGSETMLGDSNSESSCKFGDKEIKSGEFVERNNITLFNGSVLNTIKCECTLPPLASCVET